MYEYNFTCLFGKKKDRYMKPFLFVLLMSFCFASVVSAQFRGEEPVPPSVREGIQRQTGSGLGFLDLDRLEMNHSLSASYMSMGSQGIGVTMYTNSLRYRISKPLSVSADVSLMFTPFGTMSRQAMNDMSGIFLSRASVDYRPSKNFQLSLQYQRYPYSYHNRYGMSPFGSGFGVSGSTISRDDESQDLP